jgi:hypothetical protein
VALAVALSSCASHKAGVAASSSTTTTSSSTTTTTTTQVSVVTGVLGPTSTRSATIAPVPCQVSDLTVTGGKSSGAVGTIAHGFVIRNMGAGTCTINGYPTIALVPAAGILHPVVTHLGSAAAVTIVGEGSAGFVLEYGDMPVDGQTTCPQVTAVDVTLPQVGSAKMKVAAGFSPCGAPDVRVSAVLSPSQYESLVG